MVDVTLEILVVDATGSAARPELWELAPTNTRALDGQDTATQRCSVCALAFSLVADSTY